MNNDLIPITTKEPLTMSSREIAELTGKSHGNVLRDVRQMLDSMDDSDLNHVFETKDARGYTELVQLPKNLTLTLVAGYNVKLRKTIIDRWQELEDQIKQSSLNPANLSRMQLIQIAMEAEQERQALEDKVEEMTPAVQAFERIADADGSINITNAAKALQINPTPLFNYMSTNNWIYRRNGSKNHIAYQERIKQGYLVHKVTTVLLSDGTEKISEQVRVTPKGLAKLAKIFNEKKVAACD